MAGDAADRATGRERACTDRNQRCVNLIDHRLEPLHRGRLLRVQRAQVAACPRSRWRYSERRTSAVCLLAAAHAVGAALRLATRTTAAPAAIATAGGTRGSVTTPK